ncbi:DEBR0S3_13432g1_1 [Brettanomyces bruxellensis]|uniref:DEBR0S3_13432g1_1 n=1 Tax=Dekkera bruxellensis TaxID=5007 RepID=A0A7D9CYN9_DEKBR|nr:DEBR0S3_13432g1_1 [Brettanomyces bruxellensis]
MNTPMNEKSAEKQCEKFQDGIGPPQKKHISLKKSIALVGICILLTIQLLAIRYAVNISVIQLTAPSSETPSRSFLPRDVLAKAYLAALEENLAGNWSRQYGSEEQLAGTNVAMANWTREKFEQFGWDARVDEYLSYVSYPGEQALSLVEMRGEGKNEKGGEENERDIEKGIKEGNVKRIEKNSEKAKSRETNKESNKGAQKSQSEGTDIHLGTHIQEGTIIHNASFLEDAYDQDQYSQNSRPAFLGYSGSGDVTAEYVFCNYGTREDFATLEQLGVPLAGKIAVMRYGRNFRGLKVKFAQDHNMTAALLFSDPVDDGNVTVAGGVKAYPDGPARNPSSIQRGSVQFLSILPGDPTTPGYAIKPGEDKSRSDPYYALPRIPALPLSERDATAILGRISGHGPRVAGWGAGLISGFDYSVGPNPAFRLAVHSHQNATIATLHNVLARVEGRNKNDVIVIGNHRDSWTPSAGDPHSGSAVMLELARGLGDLTKLGWKPQRTIVLASWDGEEYGLLGSTDFATYYAKRLQANVVAYINMDAAVTGPNFNLAASPMLYEVVQSVASELPYSETRTLLDHLRHTHKGTSVVGNLGSGSDYTVFLERLGIPAVDMGFQSAKNSPVYHYHSIYDNYNWMTRYGDPGFKLHNLLARYAGLLVLDIAETKVLRLKTADYAVKLAEFSDAIFAEVPDSWLYTPAFAPGCPYHRNMTVRQIIDNTKISLAKMLAKNQAFDKAAELQQHQYDHWDDLSFWEKVKLVVSIARTNRVLKYYERRFLSKHGLRNRPWFKHVVFVSGRYTGYAGQQLPGMAEALEDGKQHDFVHELVKFDMLVSSLAR